jgi:hypothetical protein
MKSYMRRFTRVQVGGGCSGGKGEMLPQPSRLLRRTLGRTLGLVGSLAMRMGLTRRALLILGGIAALLVVALVVLAVVLALIGAPLRRSTPARSSGARGGSHNGQAGLQTS